MPARYAYIDGNNNRYEIDRVLVYIPITPAQSSSGLYSGGAPNRAELTDAQLAAVLALLDRLAEDPTHVLVERPKGCGTVVRDDVCTFVRDSAPLKAKLERMLADLLA
jgi:hypothetical protein